VGELIAEVRGIFRGGEIAIGESPIGDGIDDAVDELVAKVLRFSTTTIATGKRAYWSQAGHPESSAYEITTPVMASNAAAPGAQEGTSAFLEKRDPVWTDRY